MERGHAIRAAGVLLAPLGLERDRLRRPGIPARVHAARGRHARGVGGRRGMAAGPRQGRAGARPRVSLRGNFWMGARRPPENDSAFLLDVHKRAVDTSRMRGYRDDDEVDMLIVGCGAGGGTLAQRLARRGWRVVVLEKGPFWDPDRDWVSDEAGSHKLFWTDKRIIGGSDPVELGKNNSGHGVGGSMVHYAGYTPRFHPSDFETFSRDGVGHDWPISYAQLKPHYEKVERELPVAGQDWPWGDPHSYPHAAHPIGGAADQGRRGASKAGIEMRVGPVAIPNGTFGNRPH